MRRRRRLELAQPALKLRVVELAVIVDVPLVEECLDGDALRGGAHARCDEAEGELAARDEAVAVDIHHGEHAVEVTGTLPCEELIAESASLLPVELARAISIELFPFLRNVVGPLV